MSITFEFDLNDWVWIDKSFSKEIGSLRISDKIEKGRTLGRIGGLRKIAWMEYLVLVKDGKHQMEIWIEPRYLSRANINPTE